MRSKARIGALHRVLRRRVDPANGFLDAAGVVLEDMITKIEVGK